jgi:hypothetical protein
LTINFFIPQFDSGRVKLIASPKSPWQKRRVQTEFAHAPSSIYFSRFRVRGKLIRRSLKTNSLMVAKLRLGDLEKVERQRVEVQGAVENGNLRFGDALRIFRGRLQKAASLNHAPERNSFVGLNFQISIFATTLYAVANERHHPRGRRWLAVVSAHAGREQTAPAGL